MQNIKIAVIGLGYVGLPLARLFATKYAVVGFDINKNRIEELRSGVDSTLEVEDELLQSVLQDSSKMDIGLYCSSDLSDIEDCNYYVITVPTPVDKNNRPDLTPLYKSSETVGKVLKKGDIVIYESTVYPGVTEEECIPVLEKVSGLTFNKDFYAGYSPERINPGDKLHTVEKILNVTAGSTPEIGEKVDALYASVITAGTHLAPTIKVAEAAKVIDAVFKSIISSLKIGNAVRLIGFGTFKISKRKATTGRHPRTGNPIHIPAINQPKFVAGKKLKEEVNS